MQVSNEPFKTRYALVLGEFGRDTWLVNIRGGWLVENYWGTFEAGQHWRRLPYTAYKKRRGLEKRIIYGNAQNITAHLDNHYMERLMAEENTRREQKALEGKNVFQKLYMKLFDKIPYLTEEEEKQLIIEAIKYHLQARRVIWRKDMSMSLEEYCKKHPKTFMTEEIRREQRETTFQKISLWRKIFSLFSGALAFMLSLSMIIAWFNPTKYPNYSFSSAISLIIWLSSTSVFGMIIISKNKLALYSFVMLIPFLIIRYYVG